MIIAAKRFLLHFLAASYIVATISACHQHITRNTLSHIIVTAFKQLYTGAGEGVDWEDATKYKSS